MITSITTESYPYVLLADRKNPVKEQTTFFIKPKTVRGVAKTAAEYVKVMKDKKGSKTIDLDAMNQADIKEWLSAVSRIDNFGVKLNCPGPSEDSSGYDHFLKRSEDEPSKYAKAEDGTIVISSTTEESDLRYIMWAMSPADYDEIMEAYVDFSQLKEGLKKG